MRIPREISGQKLIKLLNPLGYQKTRQVGSHIRLSTDINGKHNITVPNHNPIKVGTLSSIIGRIADHHNLTKQELLKQLFS